MDDKRKKQKDRAIKAWHIVHYDELFRAKDTGGRVINTVKYAQDIMAGSDEFSSQHLIKMEVLEAQLGFEKFVIAKHIFMQLLKHSHRLNGELIRYRGYILDECLRSPGPAKIATLCRGPVEVIKKYLPVLQQAGLIERINLPADKPKGSPPQDEKKKRPIKNRQKVKTQKAPNAGRGTYNRPRRAAQTSCGSSTTSCGSSATSLQESETEVKSEPRPSASEKVEDKEKSEPRPSASDKAKANNNKNAAGTRPSLTEVPKSEGLGRGQGDLRPELDRLMRRLSRNSMSDGPTSPNETDAQAGEKLERLAELQRKLANPQLFADLIYDAIKDPYPKDSLKWAQEHGVYFSFWQEVMHRRIGIEAMESLWNRCICAAQRIARKRDKIIGKGKRPGKGSPGAVWRYEANERLKHHLAGDSEKLKSIVK